MIRIFKLVVLLVISQVAFGQAPSNYTNINGRYRWIAGMFDSTFHIPKGSTPSLRTGGSTNSGGLFYNTSDSSVYTYTGTQWIKLRGSINPSDTTNKYVTQVYKKSGSDSIFYVKGGTHTWAFNDSTGSPGGGGGGKIYYFNGGVSMGTISGLQMYELGDTANTGTAANFTRSTTGNIANFITDPGKPGLLQIPAGVWSVDAWLSETGGGANHAEIWIEVEKWDGSTITTIATSPIEQITEGATPNLYSWSVSIPTTSLTVTDRIIIQFYISNTNGKTVTLYTQNGYVGEVHTTFTTGIGAINGLTAPAQYLVTGTSGTDFNINSSTATHTFNLPTASSMIRGALSPTDWSAFNNKIGPSDTASMLSPYLRSNVAAATYVPYTGATTNVNLGVRTLTASGLYIANTNALFGRNAANNSDYSLIGITGADKVYIDAGNLGTTIGGPLTLATLNNATVDTDAFLVSDGGVVKYRTGTQLLSDIGAASSSSISGTTNYIPKFTSSSSIGNSVIYEDGSGDIGIGTISPSSIRLNVLARSGYEDVAYFRTAGTNIMARINLIPTGTAVGSINSSANALAFQVAGSEKARLDASGNLGLGTSTTGGARLYVNGASLSSVFDNTTGVYSRWKYNGGNVGIIGTANQIIGGASNTGFALGTESNDYVLFVTNNAEKMRLDASGNLGLGVTPSAWGSTFKSFDESAGNLASFSTSELYLTQGGYNNSGWKYTATGFASQYLQVNGQHRWNTAPSGTAGNAISFTQAMTLDASGRLGIGTTSPQRVIHGYIATGPVMRLQTNGSNAAAEFIPGATDGTGSIFNWVIGAQYNIGNVFEITPSNAAGSTTFSTPAFVVTSSRNVGIGTTSPNIKLVVAGPDDGTMQIRMQGTAAPTYYWEMGREAMSTGDFRINESNAGSVSNRFTIKPGGNVGIGTTSPQTELHIKASSGWAETRIEGASGSGAVLEFYSNSSALGDIYYDASSNYIIRTGTTERMRITSGGNVGIGTTSPSSFVEMSKSSNSGSGGTFPRLAIKNTLATQGDGSATFNFADINISSGNEAVNMFITTTYASGTWSPAGIINVATNHDLQIKTNNTERMRITSAGNVGIGTTSPVSILNLYSSLPILRWQNPTSGTGVSDGGDIYLQDNDFWVRNIESGILGFATSGAERMRITSGGELLINTTSDAGDYKLQVNGNGYFTGAEGNLYINSSSGSGKNWQFQSYTDGKLYINVSGVFSALSLDGTTGAAVFNSSIKTAAPSGGTAKPWKLGQAGVSVGGANTTAVAVEIDGTVYYLLTAYLPEPEPDPAALPSSGPSASYKPYNKPIPVKTTKDVEIENLRKEIEELKQLIKNK